MQLRLVPFAGVDPVVVERLVQDLTALGIDAEIGDSLGLPEVAYEPHRRQHLAEPFLLALEAVAGERVLGLTDVDLYVASLNFIFGLAERPGRLAVISLHRLHDQADEQTFRERVVKEAVHELGHTLGLTHCPDPHCVMHFSNALQDTDRKGRDYCVRCRAKLPATARRGEG